MYATCLFCHAGLGANEAIEHFPVGRRLAFDPARGRLWVVCTRCGRWNLTPLEERWEAIEECERRYRGTTLRASTENIGLARLREGLDLVRIGEPQRPEFAAWRYGDQFGRRRRQQFMKVGLGLGAFGAVFVGGVAAGVGVGAFGYWAFRLAERIVKGSPRAVVARLSAPGRDPIVVRRRHLSRVRLLAGGGDRWSIAVPYRHQLVEFEGERAVRVAGLLLPKLNRFGGSKQQVSTAVELLEAQPDPMRYFGSAARMARSRRAAEISTLPEPVRLALEMAAHEETERLAMEGELAMLEEAWRQAEEIAAIADDMFLPRSITDFIERHRKR